MSLKNQFIPHESALQMKLLGFSDDCFGHWFNNTLRIAPNLFFATDFTNTRNCLAPTWYQLHMWLMNDSLKNDSFLAIIADTQDEYHEKLLWQLQLEYDRTHNKYS